MKGTKDSRASYVLGGFFVPLYDTWMGGWWVGGREGKKGERETKGTVQEYKV